MGAKRGQRRGPGQAERPAGRQRLGLILFGLLFVLLFIGFAVTQGIGATTVSSGDVAVVDDAPEDLGTISEEELDRALVQQAAQAQLKEVPKPGDDEYEELKKTALEELLNSIWLQGQAEELGISVTETEIEKELDKIKEQSFPTPQAYAKFLQESKLTQEDVDDRVKMQILGTKIQEKANEEAPEVTAAEIADYYQAEKAAKFTTKESRDVRLIANEDKAEVEAAKKALEKDNSPASWKKVAAKYSSDASTNKKGGLQPGVQEEFLPPQLQGPLFEAGTGELIGPIKLENNYLELEVTKLNPGKTKSLAEAEAEITSTLTQEKQQEFFGEFVSDYQVRWESRTTCADDFLIESCGNYVGSGHPANAPPACYEEDPVAPVKECPAPVAQTQPALPGTVTEGKPKGEPFPQRPLPETSKEESTVAPEGPPAPEAGAPPPEGAAPPPEGAAPPSGE